MNCRLIAFVMLSVLGMSARESPQRPPPAYPKHWWAPVPKEAWRYYEILTMIRRELELSRP